MYIVYLEVWIIGYKLIEIFKKVLKKILFSCIIKKCSNIGVSPSGKASDSDSDIHVFESQYPSQKYRVCVSLHKLCMRFKALFSMLFEILLFFKYTQIL